MISCSAMFGTSPNTVRHLPVEDRDEIETALGHCRSGIDFADALHLAASKACTELLTFDDRGYARRARKLRLKPPVRVPHG